MNTQRILVDDATDPMQLTMAGQEMVTTIYRQIIEQAGDGAGLAFASGMLAGISAVLIVEMGPQAARQHLLWVADNCPTVAAATMPATPGQRVH